MIKGAYVMQLHGAKCEMGHKNKRNLTLDTVLSLSWCCLGLDRYCSSILKVL